MATQATTPQGNATTMLEEVTKMPSHDSLYSNEMSRRPKTHHGVRSLSIREKAYAYIQQLIASGALPAGSGVSELVLAKELGSSRTPIREAMNQLAAEGLLSQSPGGGMVVAQLTREDIIELYELREALEVYTAGKIARLSLSSADQARLQSLVDEVAKLEQELAKSKKPSLDPQQMERFIRCDFGFHALLMSITNNSRLQKIISDTRLLIRIFAIQRTGHDAASLKSIREYHQTILDTVARQDADAAMSALAKHIQESQQERLREYDEKRRELSLRDSEPVFYDIPNH